MSDSDKEKRSLERNHTSISVVVKGRDSIDTFWEEESKTINVSRLGANFNLIKECPPGQILFLMLKMPKNFRCYDWDKKLYPVWAVVQYCTPITRTGEIGFHIGVAFVGKDAPQSYQEDPKRTYKLVGMAEDGFWNLEESKIPYVYRVHPRFPYSIKVRVAIIDSEGNEIEVDENAVTNDISVGGAAVFSNLEVEVGDCVKFISEDYDFSSISLVRNRQKREGHEMMLHLSFSESKFPVYKLETS